MGGGGARVREVAYPVACVDGEVDNSLRVGVMLSVKDT